MTIKHQLQMLEYQNEAIAHLMDNDLNCSTKNPSMLNQEWWIKAIGQATFKQDARC